MASVPQSRTRFPVGRYFIIATSVVVLVWIIALQSVSEPADRLTYRQPWYGDLGRRDHKGVVVKDVWRAQGLESQREVAGQNDKCDGMRATM